MDTSNKIIDLHVHSNFSEDADLSVEEIFKLAQKLSLSAISITDHDSINSINEANNIKNRYSLEYVPGIEITTVFSKDNSQQHILGYFIDNKNTELLNCLEKIVKFRIETAHNRIEALKKLNFFLDEDKIKKATGERPLGPVIIISEVFNNKKNLQDKRLHVYLNGEKKDRKVFHFYNDFLSEGKPAYIPFKSVSTEEAINIIKKAGGIPVIAHPIYVKNRADLDIIKNMGIAGLEAVSTYHKPEDILFYNDYAKHNNLLVTAGSDFHGPTAKPNIQLGRQDENTGMNYSYFEKLKEYYNKIQR